MENSHHSFVSGAMVAILGVAIGAGSVLSAQMVSFSGMNPRHAIESANGRIMNDDGLNARSANQDAADQNYGTYVRDAHDSQHQAAPEAEEGRSTEYLMDRCERIFGPIATVESLRGKKCYADAKIGTEYQP